MGRRRGGIGEERRRGGGGGMEGRISPEEETRERDGRELTRDEKLVWLYMFISVEGREKGKLSKLPHSIFSIK